MRWRRRLDQPVRSGQSGTERVGVLEFLVTLRQVVHGLGSAAVAGDAQEEADTGQEDEEIGTAPADKGQGQALVGQGAGDDADVDQGLEDDQEGDAAAQEEPEGVGGIPGNDEAAYQDRHKGNEHQAGPDQAEFLSDDSIDEIGRVRRQVAELLRLSPRPRPVRPPPPRATVAWSRRKKK